MVIGAFDLNCDFVIRLVPPLSVVHNLHLVHGEVDLNYFLLFLFCRQRDHQSKIYIKPFMLDNCVSDQNFDLFFQTNF